MKFYIHKLGCPKNDVDADYISGRLISDGHEPVTDPNEAESIIINTCGFILPAKEESIAELLRFGQLKKMGKLQTLYATGCLSQRYGADLISGMPELDGAFGLGDIDTIAAAVRDLSRPGRAASADPSSLKYINTDDRFVEPDVPYAYLKISDGCDRRCAYCAIPMIRGPYRSRPIESVVAEARFLAGEGKKELIIVSQDATMYGHNNVGSDKTNLPELLDKLEQVDGIDWIRLMYLHPAGVNDGLIQYVTSSSKVLPYFDLPLQHINDEILTAMHRKVSRVDVESLLDRIRSNVPNAVIRTSFIVGFPGETQDRYEELRTFVQDVEFDRLGVFCYSPEEDTVAVSLPDSVPEEIAFERLDELMTLQQEIAFEKNNSLIGQIRDVIIDAADEDRGSVGRTYADCPDIDQEVFVRDACAVGDIVRVKITGSRGYDLEGTVLED